jgi:hypothetical protein
MARAERMLRDEQIAHELETYNELIPESGELSATFFIEIDDEEALQYWLPRLKRIQRFVHIAVGDDLVDAVETDEERLTREDEITSTVHYLKVRFTDAQRAAFAAGPVAIVVDHPEYAARTVLTDDQRDEIVGDFAA